MINSFQNCMTSGASKLKAFADDIKIIPIKKFVLKGVENMRIEEIVCYFSVPTMFSKPF